MKKLSASQQAAVDCLNQAQREVLAQQAERIATVEATMDGSMGKVSFWQRGNDVYRLNEYEPVQFDTYGLPLGARWECTRKHYEAYSYLFQWR